MRMLVVIYGGPRTELVPDLLDRQGVIGWTRLADAHGAGSSGRRGAAGRAILLGHSQIEGGNHV